MSVASKLSDDERDALTLRADSARQNGLAAAAALKPIVGAAAGLEESRPNPRIFPRVDEFRASWDLGVSVSWQLFDGGKSKADRAAAAAQATALERRRDDFDAMLGVELRQRRLDVEAGKAALESSAEGVTAATEARRVVEERFKAGVSTNTEVLDAQTALLEAELQRTQLAAQLRLSEARLLRAVGSDPVTALLVGEDPDGRWHVFQEWYKSGQLQATVVQQCKAQPGNHFLTAVRNAMKAARTKG